jgi:hypothetical protein
MVAIGGIADIVQHWHEMARSRMTQSGHSAMSESCPKLRGELLGRRTLANEKMVNRVGRHKCGVTLWQM